MAEYGYIHSDYNIIFEPKYPYWWSSKTFGESSTTVPEEFESMLRAMYDEYITRAGSVNGKPYNIERKDGKVKLLGLQLSWSKQKTEDFWGWEDGCKHDWNGPIQRGYGEYEWCSRCHKRKCYHQVEYVIKYYGDPDWFCQTCGMNLEEDDLKQAWSTSSLLIVQE